MVSVSSRNSPPHIVLFFWPQTQSWKEWPGFDSQQPFCGKEGCVTTLKTTVKQITEKEAGPAMLKKHIQINLKGKNIIYYLIVSFYFAVS